VPWPPQLQDVKDYVGVTDNRDDASLQVALDAAVSYVEDVLAGSYNFVGDPLSLLPLPTARVVQGTVRYAARQHSLRRSPDGTIDMGELGTARIPTYDPAIEQLLGIGRWRAPMVG
jgi:hypothetical protein